MKHNSAEDVMLPCPSGQHAVPKNKRKYRTPSKSSSVANLANSITPGSEATNKDDPLLAFACATEDTPTYVTSALMSDMLYLSDSVSLVGRTVVKRSFSIDTNEGDPLLNKY